MACVTEALLAWNNKWQDGEGSHEWSGKKLSSLQKAPFNLNDKTGAVIGGFIKNGSTLAAERDRIPNKPLKYPSEVLVSDFTT